VPRQLRSQLRRATHVAGADGWSRPACGL
jgi:hypothetical protein